MGATECPLAESPLCHPWRGWVGLHPQRGGTGSPANPVSENSTDGPGTFALGIAL